MVWVCIELDVKTTSSTPTLTTNLQEATSFTPHTLPKRSEFRGSPPCSVRVAHETGAAGGGASGSSVARVTLTRLVDSRGTTGDHP